MKEKFTIIYKKFSPFASGVAVCRHKFIECELDKIYDLEDDNSDEYDDIDQIMFIFNGWIEPH